MLRDKGDASAAGMMRGLTFGLLQGVGDRIDETRMRLEQRASVVARNAALRAAAGALALLALGWLCVGATALLSTRMEFWWACFIVSGALALCSVILFTVRVGSAPTRSRGLDNRPAKETTHGYPEG